jgi:ferredoxin-type protein NapH
VCGLLVAKGGSGTNLLISEPLGVLQLIFAGLPKMSFSFVTATLVIGVAVFIVTTILVGKAFCAWACPVGTVIDAIDIGLEKLKYKPFFTRKNPFAAPSSSKSMLRNDMTKYAVLGSALAGSAFLGMPVWCVFCPIGSLCRGAIAAPELAVGAEILSVPAVGALSIGEKRLWCKYLCPVGAFLTLLSKYNVFVKPRMREQRHRNCGLCVEICPEGINLCEEKSYARCTKCLDCYVKCPSRVVKLDLT